jgi:RNase H-fold protein (predicted Holliday junction resolvase)
MLTRSSDTTPVVVAVDPGREKTGLAVVRRDGSCAHREIVPTADAPARVRSLVEEHHPVAVVVGDRTASAEVARSLAEATGIGAESVDEHRSTEEARELWRRTEPARGLARLLPAGLRVPREPVDDYAAWVLGRRWHERNPAPGGEPDGPAERQT